jgi:hypothetical protein
VKGQVVVQIDSAGFFERPEQEREAIKAFLAAHGIPPNRFMIGDTSIVVRIGPDGGLWLDTWRAIEDDNGKVVLCEHCPACVRQERVEVPLATALPQVPDAFYSRDLTSLNVPSGEGGR